MAELAGAEEVGEQVLAVCGGGDTLVEFHLGELDVLFAVSKHFFGKVVLL